MNPLRAAAAFEIDSDLVENRLDRTKPRDEQFFQCWQASHAIPVQRIPNGLAGTSGHVAESVVECWLADFGLIPIADQDGPGRHGVDLLMLDPEVETVLAIEVKGTLRAGRLPWLTKRELTQMSPAWLDQKDNPAMAEFGVDSADVYGAVIAINFAEMRIRAALTQDFVEFKPAMRLSHISSTDWL